MIDLSKTNVILTGATGGIGNSILEKLINSGANVLQVEHSRFTMDLSASVAKLDITIETQNQIHLKEIIRLIKKNGLPVSVEGLN